MSQQLISRNADLKRLRDEGYDLEIKLGYLLVKQVPYVNASREVRCGVFVTALDLNGETTIKPQTHVAFFAGDHPCHKDGSKIEQIAHGSSRTPIGEDFATDHSFSSKPRPEGYYDYYEKVTAYVRIITNPARALDPAVTATVFPAVRAAEDESVFHYIDTASSRSGITSQSARLASPKLAIIGLGGTGAYVLDFISKAPAKEIHLFDGDKFSNHNAFRSPGAPSLTELDAGLQKVNYFSDRYSNMHRHIIPHDKYINPTNVDQLAGMSFVFLCIDKGTSKQLIVETLEKLGVPFIDVGMGVDVDADERLGGIIRVTASTPEMRDHVRNKQRISFGETDGDDEYDKNIQIADLNALNAALAVIKWKKLCGFYRDLEREHFSAYTVDGNCIINDDTA
jgi:hypothetical protein